MEKQLTPELCKDKLGYLPESKEVLEINRDISERQELERVLTGQIWDHMSI